MIFSTQNQLYILLIFLLGGIISGICSSFFSIIFLKKYQKNLVKSVFLSVFYLFFCVFFIFLLNFFNFGNFSLILVLSYLIGFLSTKNLTKNLVVILQDLWYNKIKRTCRMSSQKIKGENKKDKNEITNKS